MGPPHCYRCQESRDGTEESCQVRSKQTLQEKSTWQCIRNAYTAPVAIIQKRREEHILTLFYKVVNNLVAIPPSYLPPVTTRSTRGNKFQKFQIPSSNVDVHRYSFIPRTVRLWNYLPTEVASAPTVDAFKICLASRRKTAWPTSDWPIEWCLVHNVYKHYLYIFSWVKFIHVSLSARCTPTNSMWWVLDTLFWVYIHIQNDGRYFDSTATNAKPKSV